jgi:hypothetical protein
MKNLLVIFTAVLLMGHLVTNATAKEPPQVDEVEALLNKVSQNIHHCQEATAMAQKMTEGMVASKIAEKEQLKTEVANALKKVEAEKSKITNLQKVMLFFGLDTMAGEPDTASLNNTLRINGF